MAENAAAATEEVLAASKVIKKYAAKQKIRIKLDQETLERIAGQMESFDPNQPAEVTFYVGRRAVAGMRLAVCAYRGDTCCA